MKEEPINKKLMELAEGKLPSTREKSIDSFQKKPLPKEKPETKETPATESKRTCIDESLQTLHTESDLSDISDDRSRRHTEYGRYYGTLHILLLVVLYLDI